MASIWLIKRFVDKEAHFKFIGKDESADATEIPFDMPDAQLRRFQARSTFETILTHYAIRDDNLIAIGNGLIVVGLLFLAFALGRDYE